MSIVLIVILVVIAVSAVGLLMGRRLHRRSRPAYSERTASAVLDSPGSTLEPGDLAIATDELLLVPLPNRRNEALVLGSHAALTQLDAEHIPTVPLASGPGALPQLVRSAIAAGGAEATRRAQLGVDSGRIVALSEETMKHLRDGKPVPPHA